VIEMDGEKLIEAVRSFPCLWEVSRKAYKDLRARENAWKAVSMEVSECLFCSFFFLYTLY